MNERIAKIVDSMTLEQKAGQLLVFGFGGAFPHRDIMEAIEKYHVAGFRITPHGRKFSPYIQPDSPLYPRIHREPEPTERIYNTKMGEPRLTVAEMAETLNVVRQHSLDTGAGIPVYFAHDFEGNSSADTLDHTMVSFPHPMALAATRDPELIRRVGWVVGRQLKAAGVDMIHGPVLDVNTDPENPEISSRSYSPLPDVVSEYALQHMLGQIEGGLIATGKHFPGRGASKTDAHYSVPVVDESAERMHDVHLAPYRKLIEHGLPAIMLAHSIYPAIDPDEEVATISKRIVTGLLREEMGFDGVVMTDSFTMAGLMMRVEVAEGVVRAIEAGVDLILLKDETALRGEVFNFVLESIRKGRLSEERVNESVARTLIMKERFGMLDGRKGIVDIDELRSVHADPEHRKIATQAAERSVVVLRKEGDIFPFKPGTKVLVVEEPFGLQREMNNSTAYCGAIYQRLRRHGVDAYFTDFDSKDIDKAWPVIQERASWCDVVVFTGYRRRGRDQVQMEAYERFLALGKPLIFVANSPYPMLVSPKLPTVLVTCHTGALSSYAVADILVGDVEPTGQFGFDPAKTY